MQTDLVQFITDQLDALPLADQREVIQYLSTHYHVRTHYGTDYGFRRSDLPPHIPLRETQRA